MKSYRNLFAALLAALFFTAAAYAAEASPTGTWKWTTPGRGDNPGFEQSVTLTLKDGQLTGTMAKMQAPWGEIPEMAIADASFKDGEIKFSVTREFNGRQFTSKYSGKLDGDTIKGTIERPGRDGEVQKRDWVANRAK